MNAPRIARALSLDFPAVPDDAPVAPVAPPPVKQPRVWQRQDNTCSVSHPCAECQAAVERMVAREALIGPLLRRCP